MPSMACVLETHIQVLTLAHQEHYSLRFRSCPIFGNKYRKSTQNQQNPMGYKDSTLLPATHNYCDTEVDLLPSVFLLSASPGALHCDVYDREQIICCPQEHPLGGRQLEVICAIYETETIFLALSVFYLCHKVLLFIHPWSLLSQPGLFFKVLKSNGNMYVTLFFLKSPDSLSPSYHRL